jgi:hypothetical protein
LALLLLLLSVTALEEEEVKWITFGRRLVLLFPSAVDCSSSSSSRQ